MSAPHLGENERLWLLTAEDGERRRRGPTPRAVRAFGVQADRLRRFPGGQGDVWTDGRLVLKAVGCPGEHDWVCEVYAAWAADDVRVPEPVPPGDADATGWSVEGWGAHVLVPGSDMDLPRDVAVVKEASDAFHRQLRDLPRPAFLDTRIDPWAFGDRLAWEEAEPDGDAVTLAMIERLRQHLVPVAGRSQVIHGDILPNVLAHDALPPAVIDWPPYFRPEGLANAIAVTDAVTFRGAPFELFDEWVTGEDWDQLLVRAMLFRLGPTGVFAARNRLMGSLVTHVEKLGPVVDEVERRLATGSP